MRSGRTFLRKVRLTDKADQGYRRYQLMACSTCDNDSLSGCHYLLHGPQFVWLFGGEGRVRTSEGFANRFTVCSLWPLGNLTTFVAFVCCPAKNPSKPSSVAHKNDENNPNFKILWPKSFSSHGRVLQDAHVPVRLSPTDVS